MRFEIFCSEMNFDPRLLVGTWHATLCSDPSHTGIYRILDDYRHIAFVENSEWHAKNRWLPIRLWGSMEGDNGYRLKPRKNDKGWLRRLSFDGDVLIVTSAEDEKKQWRCVRLSATDIPDWFETEVVKCLTRPRK
jgi:hypothetical protein